MSERIQPHIIWLHKANLNHDKIISLLEIEMSNSQYNIHFIKDG